VQPYGVYWDMQQQQQQQQQQCGIEDTSGASVRDLLA
jgi:hypothetical protein